MAEGPPLAVSAHQEGRAISVAGGSGSPPTLPPAPAGMCHLHCGRPKLRGWPGCCRICTGPGGYHTRRCDNSFRGSATVNPPAGSSRPPRTCAVALGSWRSTTAASSTGASASESSVPLSGGQEVGDCPVCLEPLEHPRQWGPCGHLVCQGCHATMAERGFHACVLCRGPPNRPDPGTSSRDPEAEVFGGHVLLQGPEVMNAVLGYHPGPWRTFVDRVREASGIHLRAGDFRSYGIHLRRVGSELEALGWWSRRHPGATLVLHDA